MKTKSLFISTIAMVVMLIVALSVGTFAWYTAQNVVEAQNASVGAVETSSAAIGLGWAQGSALAPTITLGEGNVRPMIPKTMPADNNIPDFNEALLETDTNNDFIVKSQQGATPWQEHGLDPENQKAVWINNLDATLGARITTKVTTVNAVDAEGNPVPNLNELLRVSVFVKESEELTTYIGTWIGGGTAYYADLSATAGDPAEPVYVGKTPDLINVTENAFTATIASGENSGITFDLAKSTQKQIYIRAWLEGTELDNSNMSLTAAGFTVTFTAAKIPSTP